MITTINKTIHQLRDLLDAAACDAKARRIVTIFDECKRRLVIRIEGWVTFVALVLTVIGAAFYRVVGARADAHRLQWRPATRL